MADEATTTQEPTAASETDFVAGLLARRSALHAEVKPLIDQRRTVRAEFDARRTAEDEATRPTAEERSAYAAEEEQFNEQIAGALSEIRELTVRIEQEQAARASVEVAQQASRGESLSVSIIHQPATYREDNQKERSYFLDLAAMQIPEVRARASARIDGYAERLQTHAKEMADILPKRWSERDRAAEHAVDAAEDAFQHRAMRAGLIRRAERIMDSPFERSGRLEARAPTRIVGQGGYAIPPLWLITDYIPALRPGRVAAGLCRNLPLPEGPDSINIPRLLTPTLTGVQGADAAPVTSRDFSDTFQQANVKTIAGQEDVPIQLIEQSPGQILDRVLMTDLIADYNQKVDLQVLTGNGTGAPLSGGQVVGIYPAGNWGATTLSWAQASPVPVEFGQVLGAMASKTAYNRFNLMDFAYLMHPRRWFWFATGLDGASGTSGRYIVNTAQNGFSLFNVQAVEQAEAPFEGYVGDVPFGPKAYIDANVPITDNGSGALGGSNDISLGAIWDDLWLFEGDLRTRVLSEVLSGTLELRFQVYGYLAFLSRYGVSITISYGGAYGQPYSMSGSSNGVAF